MKEEALDAAFPVNQSQDIADAPSSAVLDQAPNGLDQTPPDGAPPSEPNDPAAELARVQADYQRTQNELAQVRQQAEQANQLIAQQQRQVAENAARQWTAAEQEFKQWLPTADPDEAVRATEAFYKAREQQLLSSYQQTQQQVTQERISAFADHIIQQKGLSPTDRQRLLSVGMTVHPNAMVEQADAILTERATASTETKQLRQELDILKRQMAGNGVRGALRAGGGNGSPPSSSAFDPKSPDYDSEAHYQAIMQAGGRPA